MKDDKTVKEILQKPLQEAFNAECRSYANYLRIYEMLIKMWEELEKQKDELEEKKELDEKVRTYNQALNSSEFDEIKKLVNLSDADVRKFINAFSMYKGMSDLKGKILDIEYEKDIVSKLLKAFKERLRDIQNNVTWIINYVYDANTKLEFPGQNPIAERFLIIYYSDEMRFKHRRKVIEIEGCKIGESFMKAYCSKGEEDEKQAYEWLVAEAKKYQI